MGWYGLQTWFRNLKTVTKLMSGFAAVGVIIVAVGVVGVLGLQTVREQLRNMYENSTVALANLSAASSNFGLYHDALLSAGRLTREAEFEEKVRELPALRARIMQHVKAFAAGELSVSRSGQDEASHLRTLNESLVQYFKTTEGALSAFRDSFSPSLSNEQQGLMRELGSLALSVEVADAYHGATLQLGNLVEVVKEVAKDRNDAGQSVAANRTLLMVVGALIAIVLGLGIGYWLANFFARGVEHIAQVARQAAGGRLQARAKLDSEDELGQMAESFNTMLDRITSLVQTEEERNVMQRRLMDFLVYVSEVSKGDFTKRGEVTADMFGNLADAFNLMVERISQLMRQVRDAAERVSESAAVVRESAAQMAGIAEHQADASVRTLGAVEGLTRSMRKVSDTAESSAASARQTLDATERGGQAVQETMRDIQAIRSAVQRMAKQVKGLGDRSLEISQIVSTIRDLASQTNLLALNAAIEAAGAGEAGARFAVVADQVRKLAESSTQATREIGELVKVIQNETQDAVIAMEQETQAVEAGTASALRTGDLFKEISEIAHRSAELSQVIARSSVDQTGETEQVARTIKDFSAEAASTQKAVEETRHTVEELAKLAERLSVSVGQFKIA